MELTWLGQSCFRLRGRDATALTDPCPPSTGFKIGRVAADVVTISHDAAESTHRQAVQGDAKFVTAPGEYEISGVLITGIHIKQARQAEPSRNVVFVIDIDDIRVCHLGYLSAIPHTDDAEQLVATDILLVPVGGGGALDARGAAETVSMLEPKIVIPMRYKAGGATGDLEGVEKFLKEMGAETKAAESRLNITKGGLPSDTTVVLLEPRG